MALFLFLVCAVVGSVVLTAGTAAAGRRAQIESSDQRYYSVTSAADLVKDLMTDGSVETVRKHEKKTVTVYTIVTDAADNSRREEGKEETVTHKYSNSLNTLMTGEGANDILIYAVSQMIEDYATEDEKFGYDSPVRVYKPDTDESLTKTFTIHHDAPPEGIDAALLDVDVTMTILQNGGLKFTFSAGTPGNIYTVTEKFKIVHPSTEFKRTSTGDGEGGEWLPAIPVIGEGDDEDHHTETYEETVTEIKTDKFRWEYSGTDVNFGT